MMTKLIYSLLLLIIVAGTSCDGDEQVLENGTVGFAFASLQEVENATIPLTFNIKVDEPNHGGGDITIAISGGNYGEDYTCTGESDNVTLSIEPGALSVPFTVTPIDNEEIADDVVLTLNITTASGFLILGEDAELILTILDDDRLPEPKEVTITNSTYTVGEDNGILLIDLAISEALERDASIQVAVESISTTLIGDDFTINGVTTSTVQINGAMGDNQLSFEVNIIDDMDIEDVEEIILTLVNPSQELLIDPANNQISISIFDNDAIVTPIDYIENFESNDGTSDYLTAGLGFETIIVNQTIEDNNIFKLKTTVDKFADEMDETLPSDNGLDFFYNSAQDPTLYGDADNVIVSPELNGTGLINFGLDVAYGFINENNATITLYWSEAYDGSGVFDEAEWDEVTTLTASELQTEGFGNNIYKRLSNTIAPSDNFRVAIRYQQTIDDTFYRTRMRFDNLRLQSL